MPSNSVLECYDAPEIVEDIRLQVHTEQGCSKTYILVEGEDDVKSYIRFFNDEVTEFSIAGSCVNVLDSLKICSLDEELKDLIIGIKDADFDHIKGVSYPECPSLFMTDTHDVETLMLTSGVVQKLSLELTAKYDQSILNDAIEIVIPYSYLRYYNDVCILPHSDLKGIRFDGFKMTKHNPETIVRSSLFWRDKLLMHGGNSGNRNYPTEEQLLEFIAKNMIIEDQKLQLVNGHDLVLALRDLFHTRYKSSKSYSDAQISSMIRLSYDIQDFQKTSLYNSLATWSIQHHRIILKAA